MTAGLARGCGWAREVTDSQVILGPDGSDPCPRGQCHRPLGCPEGRLKGLWLHMVTKGASLVMRCNPFFESVPVTGL